MMQLEWHTDRPDTHGYYLGVWRWPLTGQYVVSELWFNPDSIGTGWWTSRGYFQQEELITRTGIAVVAWMPKPGYPGGE